MTSGQAGDPLTAALMRALPGLHPVTIPGKVVVALRNHQPLQPPIVDSGAEARFAQTRLYGTLAGRAWQIQTPRSGPPLLELNAHLRWAAAGREMERSPPWLLFGPLPGKLAMNRLSLGARIDLASAERFRPGATKPVGKTPLGRPLLAAASFPGAEAELRTPYWALALNQWESLVGAPKLMDTRIAPLMTGTFPHLTLYTEVDPAIPRVRYAEMATAFAAGLDRLEHAFSAPSASEDPISTKAVDLVPGYPAPEPSPQYRCPKCGQMESAARQLNKFRLFLGVITSDCKVPLFQPAPS